MKHLLFICLLFAVTGLRSQTVSGTIKDSTGNLLSFSSVYIKGSNKGTTANAEGRYLLRTGKGRFTIVCQHVGYLKAEKEIDITNERQELDFVLVPQSNMLAEVKISTGEDPAYAIIRKAIGKRRAYDKQTERFQCQVYTKGQLRMRDYPKKFLGQKIDFEDGDTSKKKIIFLSETFSNYTVDGDKENVEVVSSRVSGQSDGLGLAAPGIFSFYKNNIFFGERINPRGFVSPISENALDYYRYKLENTYFEDGRMVNHIRVTPKRKHEPLFSGHIDIVDDDWHIHSLNLLLTKSASMELLDTLRIEQLYRPVNRDTWFISTQVLYPAARMFGFDGYGSFLNVYTDVNFPASIPKKSFSNTILKYLDSSNKKGAEYWDTVRPLPLMPDEVKDYHKKDSLEAARKEPRYLDSLDAVRNKSSLSGLLLSGKSFSFSRQRSSISISALIDAVSFNPAEGWVLSPSLSWSKRLDSNLFSRRAITISSQLRYGFSNHHFNSYVNVGYRFGKKYAGALALAGGSYVFQFNNNSPIGERGNTISCLLGERNRIKSYEARFLRGSFRKTFGEGFSFVLGLQYQDRSPLDNTTDFTFRDRKSRAYTPNYPSELMAANIQRHQVIYGMLGLRWQPGMRYVQLPERKSSLGSDLPVFSLQYVKAFRDLLGSDLGYSKWKFGISDNINLKLAGKFRYRLGMGGFFHVDSIQVPDYNHFNGNISTLAAEYLNSFQLLPIYQFSNTASFYALTHLEHNFNGALTNKIPGLRKLNFYLVVGYNGFYINDGRYYSEISAGFDNILKQFRVDFVQSFLNGKAWQNGIRVGLSKLGRVGRSEWP